MRFIRWFFGIASVVFSVTAMAQTPPVAPSPPGAPPPAFPGAPGTPGGATAAAQAAAATGLPWMDAKLSPDQRADMVLSAMTQDEKIGLVHGYGSAIPASLGGAGFVVGIPRLGLPDLNMADSSVGVARGASRSRYATLMPATIGAAASWDPQIGYRYGALIGRELRSQGYNVSLAGGMDIMREPRNGRSFEYLAEDPVLTGEMYVGWIHGLQDQHVIGDIKHYAFNDQETGRTIGNVVLDEKSMRESDLLAFQIGVTKGQPGMAMCAYNKVNGDWSCENDYLLNKVLKQDWGFKGWVLSDWGATHSTQKAALAGLDQEQPGSTYFGASLKQALQSGGVPQARLDDMVHRILRTEFAAGIVGTSTPTQVVDVFGGLDVAQAVSEASSVLLKNNHVLPLDDAKSIVVIGSHADVGILSGGGSAQVDPPGGNAVSVEGVAAPYPLWWPSSPLKAIQARMHGGMVTFDPGVNPAAAAVAAAKADVAIVFVNQPSSEGSDHSNLSLPDNQDALVAAVAAANPRTVVVLETGGPVTMPWLSKVAAVVEIWYPGARGADATARLLFGDVNFTAKLPVTFPSTEAALPVQIIAGSRLTPVPVTPVTTPATGGLPSVALTPSGQPAAAPAPPAPVIPGAPGVGAPRPNLALPNFDIHYPEGAEVGYKWYEARDIAPLFPFGFGLSYTDFSYSDIKAAFNYVQFTLRNIGTREGAEVAQVYVRVPGESFKRLVGWSKVDLKAGESRTVSVAIDPLYISAFDVSRRAWQLQAGAYDVSVGGSSQQTPLTAQIKVAVAR